MKTVRPSVHARVPGSPGATSRARPERAEASRPNRRNPSWLAWSRLSGIALTRDPQPRPDSCHLIEDGGGDAEGCGRRYLGEVGRHVIGSRRAAGLGEPALGEPDEHPGVAARTSGVVVMGELTGP